MVQSLLKNLNMNTQKMNTRKYPKNFKILNILYCALTIDIYESISHCVSAKGIWKTLYYIYDTNHNLVLSEFVAQNAMTMVENVKQVKDHQLHEEQEYRSRD